MSGWKIGHDAEDLVAEKLGTTLKDWDDTGDLAVGRLGMTLEALCLEDWGQCWRLWGWRSDTGDLAAERLRMTLET